jgi:hypothetical protein
MESCHAAAAVAASISDMEIGEERKKHWQDGLCHCLSSDFVTPLSLSLSGSWWEPSIL